ncbi:MAG TPA: DUF4440 domain-containing protein [Mycobacteriales bacterium]|nr:DUF4440 domain-containing protein [Mycobacteriales bacterium]
MFDATAATRALQDAVLRHDHVYLENACSDQMLWSMPSRDNQRGKRAWIDASCAVAWDWFEVDVLRQLDVGQVVVVESWIRQQYTLNGAQVVGEGVVVDVWALEDSTWRVVARHPQRG